MFYFTLIFLFSHKDDRPWCHPSQGIVFEKRLEHDRRLCRGLQYRRLIIRVSVNQSVHAKRLHLDWSHYSVKDGDSLIGRTYLP